MMGLQIGDAKVVQKPNAGAAGRDLTLAKEMPNVSTPLSPQKNIGRKLGLVGTMNSAREAMEVEEAGGWMRWS